LQTQRYALENQQQSFHLQKAVQLHLKSIVFRSQKQCNCKPKAVILRMDKKDVENE